MADNRELHGRALRAFEQLLDKVTDGQWDDPTPCAEWKVKDLVGHVTGGNHMFAAHARGDQPSAPPPNDDPRAAFAESAKIATESFASEGVNERTFNLPFGAMPAQMAIGIHFVDVVVHSWDLAKATGQQPVVDQDLVESAWGIASMFPDSPELRGPGGPFGPKVACPDDAPLYDRLIAHLGRTP